MRLRDHIEKLNYYVAAIEHGTLRKAAKAIGIGQPQLTKVLNQLEDLLETQLVIRDHKGITTTQEGHKLYTQGKKILSDIDKIEFELHSQFTELNGEITIGTYDSISRYFFPDFIKYMKSLFPALNISLYTDRSSKLIEKLEKGQIDISVFVGDIKSSKIDNEVVYEDYFSFYQKKDLDKDFSKTLIYFPESLGDTSFEAFTKKYSTFHRCENLETVLSLTLSGLGVGLIPMKVAHEHIIQGNLAQINSKHRIARHNISIGKHSKDKSQETETLCKEILRFLEVWSQNN
ncbi:MAG: LysR family transcriptional regulator [Oligoflexia bacterium]|nr:LysR family transcriptional regulator [Oligoflexia bacterium]